SHAASHLPGDEALPTSPRFVAEQDPAAGKEAMRLAVVDRDPVGVQLRHRVWAARMERAELVLRWRRQSEHLRRRGLVEAGGQAGGPNRLQEPGRAQPIRVPRVLRLIEGDMNVALGGQVVDLVGL